MEIMALLQEINSLGTTMLVVTHQLELVEHFPNRIIAIDEGLVVHDDGHTQTTFEEPVPEATGARTLVEELAAELAAEEESGEAQDENQ